MKKAVKSVLRAVFKIFRWAILRFIADKTARALKHIEEKR